MKTALVLSLGWEQEPMIQKIHDLGWEVIGIHYHENYNPIIDYKKVFIADLWDLRKVLEICDSIEFDAVISDQDDYGHFLQAVIAEKYNLPGPKIAQAQLSLNKILQREECKKKGIKIPDFKLVKSPEDIKSFASEYQYPIILKPLDNRGSIGVVKIETESEVFTAFEIACSNAHSHLMIAERFIKGYEVTVDGFCFPKAQSLAMAEKGKLDETRQVSVDIKYPAEIETSLYNEIMSNNENVANALGYDFGYIHGEYMITDNNEIYLVELANRGGGCYTSAIIVPNVCGMPILDYYIEFCLGMRTSAEAIAEVKNPTILKFFNFENGEINQIKGIDSLEENENVLKHHFYVKEGGAIMNMTSDADRHGFVIVKSEENIRAYTQELIDNIYIDYK